MMKRFFSYIFYIVPLLAIAQNIQVDSQTYTAQQLIEDILIDSDCIDNVVVTNVVGGDFGATDESYGYFDASGTSFPFERGIVLSTGRLQNTEGPNTSLRDDDATNWLGDSDLEFVLNESNTINATILEFDFTSTASEISFKYIFASEEYQENNAGTCEYSDLFGFLIKEVGNNPYENIALVPGTNTPVKVTTVHPEIPGECQAENEAYFESFNGAVSPTNFNGQTKVLTATATIIPSTTYHVKLVIADEQNFRYDSAVFLEAGSFTLSTDLGDDRLLGNGNSLCENDTLELDATQAGMNNDYQWYKDGAILGTEQSEMYTVVDAGVYSVEVTLDNNCIVYGEIRVEYSPNPIVFDSVLVECDFDQNGLTIYDLFEAQNELTNSDNDLIISNFFTDVNDANDNIVANSIQTPESFVNTQVSQVIFARVESTTSNCSSVASLQLDISMNTLSIPQFNTCDDEDVDGYAFFNFDDITLTFQSQIPTDAIVNYYLTEQDAIDDNPLTSPYKNSVLNSEVLFVKVESNNECFAISTVNLNILETPLLGDDESLFYCENTFPDTIRLYSKLRANMPEDFTFQWYFNDVLTANITSEYDINAAGIYKVVVTAQSGCESERVIIVNPSSTATIDDVTFTEATFNNTVTIMASGSGVYEFGIDDELGPYQESNIFENILPGFHTVYVRDLNGCGIVEKMISILGFPRYFTPNEDGVHDTWQVLGVNSEVNKNIKIQIFNRFGKILAVFNSTAAGWDGTYNGEKLPSNDYWFVATLPDGKKYRDHFTLKR
jgi:gliding motility-associated-like protein